MTDLSIGADWRRWLGRGRTIWLLDALKTLFTHQMRARSRPDINLAFHHNREGRIAVTVTAIQGTVKK